jgi:hypothetical protein
VLWIKALSLCEDFQKNDGTEDETNTFRASRELLCRFRNRFYLKNIKIIGEAALVDEEAVAIFPAEVNKIIKEGGCDPRQAFNCDETGLFWKKLPNKT